MLPALRLMALVLAVLAAGAAPAFAQCTVTAGGSVGCNANTTTTATTNTNGATASSSDQTQLWNNGTAITASTNGGITVNGSGLALQESGGTAAAISLVNNAGNAITTSVAANPALQLTGNGGAISYSGNGSISSTTGAGIVATNTGAGTITIATGGSISGGGGANAISLVGGVNTLTLQSGWSLTGNIANGGTSLTFNQSIPVTLSNVITGSGSVIQAGSGTLTLSGANTYSGGTTISSGTLAISSDGNLGSGGSVALLNGSTLALGAGSYTTAATIAGTGTFSVASGATATWNETVADGASAGTLGVNGGGTLVLTDTQNSYSGGTVIAGGSTLSISNGLVLGFGGSGGVTLGDASTSGTLALTGSTSVGHAFTLNAGGGIINTAAATTSSVLGIIGGAGGLTKNGTGTLTLDNNNTYTGGTTISGGTLAIGAGGSLASSGAVSLAAGTTFDISGGGAQTIGALSSAATSTVSLGANTLTFGDATASISVAGTITGVGGSLVKQGTGTTILSGANTYTGGTSINAGTLSATNATALGTGGAVVASGATLNVNSVTIANALTLNGSGVGGAGALSGTGPSGVSGTITLGSNATVGVAAAIDTFTLSGAIGDGGNGFALTKAGAGVLLLNAVNTYTGATTVSGGSLILGGVGSVAASSGVALSASGASLDISGTVSGTTVQGLTGAVGSTVDLGGKPLTVNLASGADTFSGILQDGGVANGTGGSLVTSGGGQLLLTQVNTYTGATTVSAGSLALTGTGSIATSSGVALSAGANLDISDTSAGATVQALTGAVGSTASLGNQTLTVNFAGGADTFNGVLQDGGISGETGGGLTMSGSGQLLLTQVNTYTGATTVSAGSLALTGSGSIATSSGVSLSGSTANLDISETSAGATLPGLSGVSGSTVSLGSQTLTVNLASGSNTFAGSIQNGGIGGGVGGSLAKSGAGTLMLTGASTYTGGTSVTAGTLSAGNATALGTAGATVASGATLNVNGVTIGNALTLNGSGVGTSGALSGTGTAGVSGAITLGSSAVLGVANAGDTLTLSGPIAGSSFGITKNGAGTLTLSAANTYTGATVIQAGTLAIGSGGSIASSSSVQLSASGGKFDISAGGNQTIGPLSGIGGSTVALGGNTLSVALGGATPAFGGVIQGTGGVTLATSGSLTLTGTNTYTGATTIGTGTQLILSGNGSTTTGSIASGNVTDIGTLAFSHTDSIVYAGVIAGSGVLQQNGTGTVTLTGTNTYTGGTTISAGTLQIGAGGTTGSIAGNVADNGAFVFNRSNALTFAGVISGTGTLTQAGGGTLILNGNSGAFTGSTTVAAGTLEIGDAADPGAKLGGNVAVNAGATLQGHGTIGGNVTNGGMVQPGGTIGVMTVAGNYTQAAAGSLTIEITPNAAAGAGVGYDQLKVGGIATLAGTLAIVDDPGTYTVGTNYTILTATGGRTGTFATVTYNPVLAAYITPAITYDANDAYLALDPTPSPTPSAPPPMFNGGQQIPDMGTALIATGNAVGDAVLGDGCGASARRSLAPQDGCVVRDEGHGFSSETWLRGLGGLGSLTGSGARFSFNDSYGGTLLGYGIGQGPWTVGIGAGYVASSLNFSDGSQATQQAGLGLIYGRYVQEGLQLGAMAMYGGGQVDGVRALPGTGLAATGNRAANFAVIDLRAAYTVPVGAYALEPRIGFTYAHVQQSGFTETGAGLLDLTYGTTKTDESDLHAALRISRAVEMNGWHLLPWIEAGAEETVSGLSRTASVTAGPFGAVVAGASPAPTAGLVGIGLDVAATDRVDGYIRYEGRFSANQTGNAFGVGLRYRF